VHHVVIIAIANDESACVDLSALDEGFALV
jgi:hypothetical protein